MQLARADGSTRYTEVVHVVIRRARFTRNKALKYRGRGLAYDQQRRFYRANAFREMIGPYASRGNDVRPYGSLKHVELSELSALRR